MKALTDDLVLRVMRARPGGIMTYVVRNILVSREHGFAPSLTTAAVLRVMKRLERAGKVRRVPTSYAVMICWAIVE